MTRYVITSKELKGISEQYYAIDRNRGGYPYWSLSIKDAIIFREQPNFKKEVGSCYMRMVRNIEYIEIGVIQVEPIRRIEINDAEEVKKKEMEALQKQIDELTRKMEEVKNR